MTDNTNSDAFSPVADLAAQIGAIRATMSGALRVTGGDRIRAQNRRSWSADQRTSNQSRPYRALVSTAAGAMVRNSSRVGKSASLRRSRQTYGIPRSSSTATPLRAENVFKAVHALAGFSKTSSFSTARSAFPLPE